MLTRRGFLSAAMVFPFTARGGFATPQNILVSCADDRARDHYVVGLDLSGGQRFKIKLPARGHGYAQNPANSETIVFARRPGSFFAAIDSHLGEIISMIEPPDGRCFYGHGTFSAEGTRLYVCEHDDGTGDGFIGIYDVERGYARVGDFGAGGIGPHEVRLMPDGETLVVAIGGILTDRARDKLNIATMDPSLAYIDASSGRLVEQVRPLAGWHQLSIRHIDIDARGIVAIAMQYEGDAGDAVPLAALHGRGDAQLTYLRAPDDDEIRLKHYLGDISFSADGKTILATSPVGSVAALWDARSGGFLDMAEATDGCGIVALGDAFLVSGGDGRLRRLDAGENVPLAATDWLWDNHLIVAI
jgi:hypothetical protein